MALRTADEADASPAWHDWRRRWGYWAIAAVVLVICAVSWLFAAEQVAFEREKALQTAVAQNDDRALVLQQYVSRTLGTANIAATHIAELHSRGALVLGKPRLPNRIDDGIANDPAFLGLSVADSSGEVVASTPGRMALSGNVASHPAFAAHRARDLGALFVSKPAFAPRLRHPTIWLSRRISRGDGSFAGVVAINMDPAQLTAIFGQTGVKPSETAWVVGLDGIVRSRSTGQLVSSGEDVSRGELFRLQRAAPVGHFRRRGTLDGAMRLVSHRRVPGYPLYVSYGITEDEALADARRRAWLFWAGAGLISAATLLIALLVALALRQRERTAIEVSAAKRRLEDAQRIAKIGDWTYDFATDTVVWSPQLYEMYERDPALGPMREDIFELMTEDSARAMRASIEALVHSGKPASWEMDVRLPSGRVGKHLALAVPRRGADGAMIGYHGTTQDITELRKLEALQDDLAHLSRVGAMNALTATLSHELNQPLAAATNYLWTAQAVGARSSDPTAAEIAGLAKEAQGQVARAASIIERMRKLVAKGIPERDVTSIDDVIAEALAIIAVTRACPTPILVDRAEDELLVCVDSVQLQQVILNLMRNACEAQKDRDVPPPRIEISCGDNGKLVISMVDNGPGIPEPVLKRLFEPFMSSKQSGLGLGLSISRTIVEAHGGTLQARNRPEGGAIVSITLPLHGRRPRGAHRQQEQAEA